MMKTKSQVFKKQVLNSSELESVLGGKRQATKTYDGGTLQEIIVYDLWNDAD
ncbi:hypothetical protein [Segatella albensis]|jgi:hypothetical protein|uniref:hypothetical protein n=1 Tax=Segatella albensis TaxID=77768 RepID=UPI0012B636EF|nr:hypothetical protein [Segatella albensis]